MSTKGPNISMSPPHFLTYQLPCLVAGAEFQTCTLLLTLTAVDKRKRGNDYNFVK